MKNLNVPVLFQTIRDFNIEDTRFTKVKIWLMHLGENLNGTSFTQESVMNAIPTLAYTPIMGMIEDGDFLGHEKELEIDDGSYRLRTLTQAYGVIPELNNAQFEDRVGDDGVTQTYLTVDGLLWNKWEEAIEVINSKRSKTGQSMEIIVQEYSTPDENDVVGIERFLFDGACLLGDAVKPAMVGSNVELAFSDKVDKIIKEKLAVYAKSFEEGGNKLELDKIEDEINKFENNLDETEPVEPTPEPEPEVVPDPEPTPDPEPEPEEPEVVPDPDPEPEPEPEPEVTTEETTETIDTVAYQTERVETDELPLGEEAVVQEGSDGYTTVAYLITYHDGQEHSKEEQSRKVTEPVNEVINVGTFEEPTKDVRKEDTLNDARAKGIEDAAKALPALENIVIGGKSYTVEEVSALIKELFALKQSLHNEQVDELFARHADNLTSEDITELRKNSETKSIETIENELFSVLGRKTFSNIKQENSTTSYTSVQVNTTTEYDDPYGGILKK